MVKFRERRKHKRIALELPIEFRQMGKKGRATGKAIVIKTKTKNISASGIYISSKKVYPPGTLLEISLQLSKQEKPVIATGKVIWAAKKKKQPTHFPGMGVRLAQLSKEDKAKFDRFCCDKVISFRDAKELKAMYLFLKSLVARLVELEERHEGAVQFKAAIENAIRELDEVAHLLDKETIEVKRL